MRQKRYWLRGIIVAFLLLVILAFIVAVALSTSSLCGFNTAGESHICSFSERFSMFGEILSMIFVLPFVGLYFAISKSYSLSTVDGLFLLPIFFGVLLGGGFFGWLYGKIKGRKVSSSYKL